MTRKYGSRNRYGALRVRRFQPRARAARRCGAVVAAAAARGRERGRRRRRCSIGGVVTVAAPPSAVASLPRRCRNTLRSHLPRAPRRRERFSSRARELAQARPRRAPRSACDAFVNASESFAAALIVVRVGRRSAGTCGASSARTSGRAMTAAERSRLVELRLRPTTSSAAGGCSSARSAAPSCCGS